MADPPDLEPMLDHERVYPNPRDPEEAIDRRHFLAVIGASAAVAGATGCSPRPAPHGEIVPYVTPPEQLTPGVPLHFATAMELGGDAIGLIVTSHEGRPTKIEGNPEHPASLGSSDVFSQASILGLYDPDRSSQVIRHGAPSTWEGALSSLRAALETQRATEGSGLRILTGATASPSFRAVMAELLGSFKKARWVQFEPCGDENAREGGRRAFGRIVRPVFDIRKADVILSLDADFLSCNPGTVRYQREFADRRRVRTDGTGGIKAERMNRLYVVESMLTTTGANAEHRLAVKPSMVESFARALAAELKVPGVPAAGQLNDRARAWLAPLADDLRKHQGHSIVMVGGAQPPSLHALGHALNQALGNIGQTVNFVGHESGPSTTGVAGMKQLAGDLEAGSVDCLLILGCNPAYTAPAELNFAAAIEKARQAFHLGLYFDESAVLCEWHMPEAHYLECWGDGEGFDGSIAIQQPLIIPLYAGRSASELMAMMLSGVERRGWDVVRDHWRKVRGNPADFDRFWEESVQKGVISGGSARPVAVKLAANWAQESPAIPSDDSLEIEFRPDPVIHDGRFANNGWLQELPKPVSKLTWGNAAIMSPGTAAGLGIEQRTVQHGGQHAGVDATIVELRFRGRAVRAPAFLIDGHADGAVTVHLGFGRTRAGKVGDGVGFNGYLLRPADALGFGRGLEIIKTDACESLACTQAHHAMVGRESIRHTSADNFIKTPNFFTPALDIEAEKGATTALTRDEHPPPPAARDRRLVPLSLYPAWPYMERKWGMGIDLSTCTGCSACVVACQSENNSPVVGKDQVLRGREMHWIRVDWFGAKDGIFFQPVPCMQCENAPCEYICPVEATVHSHDGLNDMIYNRCVGTRFCSNNCPYKVRRFNFLSYADFSTASLKPMRNPEVTVRSRGVMEKCTYCVQRIRGAVILSERTEKPIPSNSLQTACEQACPSRAITFGDLNNPDEDVSKWKKEPHNYGLLDELYTRPRTTYLAAIRNPNPAMPKGD